MGEALDADGRVGQLTNKGALGTTGSTFRGEGHETWHPRFSYQDFRNAEIAGTPVVLTWFDAAALYRKWMADLAEHPQSDSVYTAGCAIIPWQYYQATGEPDLVASAVFPHELRIGAAMARELGLAAEETRWTAQAEVAARGLPDRFYATAAGSFGKPGRRRHGAGPGARPGGCTSACVGCVAGRPAAPVRASDVRRGQRRTCRGRSPMPGWWRRLLPPSQRRANQVCSGWPNRAG